MPRPLRAGDPLARPSSRSLAAPSGRSAATPSGRSLAAPSSRSLAAPSSRSLAAPSSRSLAAPSRNTNAAPSSLVIAALSALLFSCGEVAPDAGGAALATASAGVSGAVSGAARAPGAPGAASAPVAPSGVAASSGVPAGGAASAKAPVLAAVEGAPATAASALAGDPPRPPDGKGAGLDGAVDVALDGEWILRLATAPIVEVTPNSGGSSVSMRVRFADGKKAALKPEQTGRPTDPRAEIAGYHVDRILGFGRTAAVAGRRLPAAALRAALVASDADAAFLDRFDRLVVQRDGAIDAAMIAWHASALVEEEAEPGWAAALAPGSGAPAPDEARRLGERSDLVVFDFLIDNPDRYSGGNILRLGKGGPLVFLDQGAAFGRNRMAQGLTTRDRLEKVCRFRPATLAALRRAGPGAKEGERLGALLGRSLARDALAPVLDPPQLAAVDERAAALLAHAGGCAGRVKQGVALPPPR